MHIIYVFTILWKKDECVCWFAAKPKPYDQCDGFEDFHKIILCLLKIINCKLEYAMEQKKESVEKHRIKPKNCVENKWKENWNFNCFFKFLIRYKHQICVILIRTTYKQWDFIFVVAFLIVYVLFFIFTSKLNTYTYIF